MISTDEFSCKIPHCNLTDKSSLRMRKIIHRQKVRMDLRKESKENIIRQWSSFGTLHITQREDEERGGSNVEMENS